MIADKTQLYNLALNAIGARSNIASPTEGSRESEVCELWYTPVRDAIFAATPWPELTKLSTLVLLNTRDADLDWTNTNARPGYAYVYALPDDIARPQYLTNFDRFLLTSYSDDQPVLVSNTESAILTYTAKNVGIPLWSPNLQMAMVYGLASHICMPLSGKSSRAKQLVEQANALLWQAREVAANLSNDTYDYTPDWIAARGFSGTTVSERFIYPVGSLLTVAAGVN